MGFILDTCIWIYVEQGLLGAADVASITGRSPVYLSPISIGELNTGVHLAPDSATRILRARALERLLAKPSIPITIHTGRIFGQIAADLRSGGKQFRQRVNDVWLASQAIEHNHTLLTRNKADFAHIPGLKLATI